ncbi:TPA: hypothetical protein DCZ46_03205 [Candidatus Campbellbacteria bacterium]|nr:MAG: hypothetical protein UR58_C0001G0614 [Candidatus Campbellbacteria bacterium GW2011_OD1_34_28]KKP74862.1 MAG: hypothetical protein UR74_C0002G0128 [Candidatus Campbellbacteria bacterium GW2011_GWD2_35_24]KKP75748.1 MAG: hypothetical protein UR75_C0002G0129 [Candidatus Campbellbacteria bacterium GW2011_GWC2_35_28]KKP77004.1 MAG: hypothetical protein UR76_C0002G0205 [Candidatus Campbellbacteria bacterium GW2011_GWC1_35_31]KKP78930.1 MAG: hypothetical protein UR79_C0002G0205 [Candidatus Cam
MKTLTKKIISYTVLSLIIQISFSFVAVKVYAYHSDVESSKINFSVASLDFVLIGNGFENSNMLSSASTSIEIKNEGSLDFKYKILPEFGDRNRLCENLILVANLNGVQVYNGYINDFSYATTSLGIWQFQLEARENSYGYCDFNFVYQGWQEDFPEYGVGGFSDEEDVSNTVFIDELTPEPVPESCIKINEVYYYPGIREGANGFENNPNDEWIELYNVCDHEVNIKKWYLNNEDNSELINQNYIIESHQFVVIAANASTWAYWPDIPDNAFKIALGGTKMFDDGLDDNGDVLMLYDDENNLIDSVSWGDNITAFNPSVSAVILGHSISRKEKGIDTNTADDWMDTYDGSTPVGPNPGTNPHNVVIENIQFVANNLEEDVSEENKKDVFVEEPIVVEVEPEPEPELESKQKEINEKKEEVTETDPVLLLGDDVVLIKQEDIIPVNSEDEEDLNNNEE